jgi:hypothetical protein
MNKKVNVFWGYRFSIPNDKLQKIIIKSLTEENKMYNETDVLKKWFSEIDLKCSVNLEKCHHEDYSKKRNIDIGFKVYEVNIYNEEPIKKELITESENIIEYIKYIIDNKDKFEKLSIWKFRTSEEPSFHGLFDYCFVCDYE